MLIRPQSDFRFHVVSRCAGANGTCSHHILLSHAGGGSSSMNARTHTCNKLECRNNNCCRQHPHTHNISTIVRKSFLVLLLAACKVGAKQQAVYYLIEKHFDCCFGASCSRSSSVTTAKEAAPVLY